MNKSANPVRKGSIPMVLIVVVCLGILAATSIFMSQNTASLDKKSELNAAAWVLAQSAVEETLLRIANNQITVRDDQRNSYPPFVTQASVQLEGLTIEPVQVFKRTITDGNATKEREFEELMEFLPGFLRRAAVSGVNAPKWDYNGKSTSNTKLYYNPTWRKDMYDNAGKGNNTWDPRIAALLIRKPLPGKPNDPLKDVNFNPSTLSGDSQKYYNTFVNGNGAESGTNTGKAVAAKFDALKPLPNNSFADGSSLVDGLHSDADLQNFKRQWDECGDAIANHMQNRIDGCNGDFDYAIGAMMTSWSRGAPCANDSNEGEETYREGARDSGQTEYKEALVTVATRVHLTRGMQKASQPFSAQRLVRSMNLQPVMMRLRETMVAYLHYNYNLTLKDMLKLKHGGQLGQIDPNGIPFLSVENPNDLKIAPGDGQAQLTAAQSKQSSVPEPQVALTSTLSDRFKDSPGTQIRNVQLATCLGELKK